MKRTAIALLGLVAALVGVTPAAATVLGTDNRTVIDDTTVFPSSAIGQLQINLDSEEVNCTAFLIDRNTILTAGHCLHTGGAGGEFASGAVFFPGRDGGSTPFGNCDVAQMFVANLWISNRSTADDWALAQLDCNVGDTTGWLRMKFLSNAQLANRAVTVRGNALDAQMKSATDQIRSVAAKTVNHKADADAAQAGSPIYQATGCSGPCVLGIHTGGNATTNRGVRITLGLIESLTEVASQNDPRPDGLIKVGNGAFAGNGEINGSGVGQVRDAHVRRGRSATFTARFQSDGDGPVDLRLKGTGGTNRISVKFFSGQTNITAAVRAGTYAINDLAEGAHRDIRIVATVAGNAPLGQNASITLMATSQEGAKYRDLVRANVFPQA
jgi:glutamyl endopeptidase